MQKKDIDIKEKQNKNRIIVEWLGIWTQTRLHGFKL